MCRHGIIKGHSTDFLLIAQQSLVIVLGRISMKIARLRFLFSCLIGGMGGGGGGEGRIE